MGGTEAVYLLKHWKLERNKDLCEIEKSEPLIHLNAAGCCGNAQGESGGRNRWYLPSAYAGARSILSLLGEWWDSLRKRCGLLGLLQPLCRNFSARFLAESLMTVLLSVE